MRTQLLSVPPWACAFGVAMTLAIFSDRIGHRFIFTLVPSAMALAGFVILFHVHDRPNLQYGALFLAASGTYSSMPAIVCWFATNRTLFVSHQSDYMLTCAATVAGHRRRSIGTAWQIGFGNSEPFLKSSFAIVLTQSYSRRYHCILFLPRPGCAKIHQGLQRLHFFHLPLDGLMHRLLPSHLMA